MGLRPTQGDENRGESPVYDGISAWNGRGRLRSG